MPRTSSAARDQIFAIQRSSRAVAAPAVFIHIVMQALVHRPCAQAKNRGQKFANPLALHAPQGLQHAIHRTTHVLSTWAVGNCMGSRNSSKGQVRLLDIGTRTVWPHATMRVIGHMSPMFLRRVRTDDACLGRAPDFATCRQPQVLYLSAIQQGVLSKRLCLPKRPQLRTHTGEQAVRSARRHYNQGALRCQDMARRSATRQTIRMQGIDSSGYGPHRQMQCAGRTLSCRMP